MTPIRTGRRIGRFERRIVLAIAVAASLPLAGALVFGRQALREAYSVGVNPRVATELEGSLESYRARLIGIREAARADAARIARDEVLGTALGEPPSIEREARIEERLHHLLTANPEITELALRRTDHRVTRAPADDVRARTFSEPAGEHVLEVTVTTPEAPFSAYLRAGETAEVYRRLDAATDYVSSFFLLLYLVLVLSSIVVAITLATLMARRMTRRVSRLAEATTKVGGGDFSVELPVEGDDEVAELTLAFNAMVRDVRHSRDRIEYLERVGAWQEMAKRLAHEIKNPLTPIQLAMQEVHGAYQKNDPRFGAKLDDAKEMVEEEIRTLRRLVNDFSEFARLPEPTLLPTDLGAFVQELGRTLDPDKLRAANHPDTAAPTLEIEANDELAVAIDPPMFRRAIDNLVRNAVHALDDAAEARAGRILLRAYRVADEAWLEVHDDGPGVASADRERVFGPYFTTKVEGTGLGLAIVKKLVLEHGGTIACTSSELGGAAFVVRLPIRPDSRRGAR